MFSNEERLVGKEEKYIDEELFLLTSMYVRNVNVHTRYKVGVGSQDIKHYFMKTVLYETSRIGVVKLH